MREEIKREIEKYFKEEKGKNFGLVQFRKRNPEHAESFLNFWRKVNQGGIIPAKYRDLMELSIVLVKQCKDCVIKHTKICIDAGCSDEEIMDAASIALVMGGAIIYEYIGYAMEAIEYFKKIKKKT